MQTETSYKIGLDKGSRKFVCPQCNKRTFVRMKDYESGEYLPDHVGRCDRENNCGYHFTLKQYLAEVGLGYEPKFNKMEAAIVERKIDLMPLDYVEKSMVGYTDTNFATYLITLFGSEIACKALRQYFVGRSRNDNGKASIYWRVDEKENVRTGKIMCYDYLSGKRNKDAPTTWVHSQRKQNGEYYFSQPYNYRLCFFGEHLLTEYPDKTIGIVESEKTAIIASVYMPGLCWIATGGNSGCKWREWDVYKVLENRTIILFPDFGFFNKKTGKTCYQEWKERADHIQEKMKCSIKVSRLLEDNIPEEKRVNDYDLADMLVKQDLPTGIALTDFGYPAIWDLISNEN